MENITVQFDQIFICFKKSTIEATGIGSTGRGFAGSS